VVKRKILFPILGGALQRIFAKPRKDFKDSSNKKTALFRGSY